MIIENSDQFDLELLGHADYLKERSFPAPGGKLYLHLSDLKLFMEQISVAANSILLDFGSGGAPYKDLFFDVDYRTADIGDENRPDFLISSEGKIEIEDSYFDVILSTQVLEHVRNYREYLSECHRLLKPGGKLVLTVPGMYEEHGCPDDYQRWMVEGLKRDVEQAGFRVLRITKLTTGPRAVLFFLDRLLDTMQHSRRSFSGALLFGVRKLLTPFRGLLHRLADIAYTEFRLNPGDDLSRSFYLGLAIEAIKN